MRTICELCEEEFSEEFEGGWYDNTTIACGGCLEDNE